MTEVYEVWLKNRISLHGRYLTDHYTTGAQLSLTKAGPKPTESRLQILLNEETLEFWLALYEDGKYTDSVIIPRENVSYYRLAKPGTAESAAGSKVQVGPRDLNAGDAERADGNATRRSSRKGRH